MRRPVKTPKRKAAKAKPVSPALVLVADDISRSVCRYLRAYLKARSEEVENSFRGKLPELARMMTEGAVPSLVDEAHRAVRSKMAAAVKEEVNAIGLRVEVAAKRADKVYDELTALISRDSKATQDFVGQWRNEQNQILADLWQQHKRMMSEVVKSQESMIVAIRKAGVETLSDLIAKEVSQIELQSMIRSEVKDAVREAIRALNTTREKETHLTEANGVP